VWMEGRPARGGRTGAERGGRCGSVIGLHDGCVALAWLILAFSLLQGPVGVGASGRLGIESASYHLVFSCACACYISTLLTSFNVCGWLVG
jgi:hypothetical protein